MGVDASGDGGMTLSTLRLDRGYYRTSIDSDIILKCHQDEACLGGVEPGQYCEEGYRGPCETHPSGVLPGDCMRISMVVGPINRKTQAQLAHHAAHTALK